MPTDSDQDLMRRIQQGEPQWFAVLFDRYRRALLRVAFSRLGDRAAAEDTVQETFLAAFKSRHTYLEQFSFRTWLWTILLNQCKTQQARRARVPRVASWSDRAESNPTSADAEDPVSAEPAPWQELLSRERAELLESLLAQLRPLQADALRLRFFGGLKFQEIADAMGCSLGTAKNRVQWGLLRLSELIRESTAGISPGVDLARKRRADAARQEVSLKDETFPRSSDDAAEAS